MVIPFSNHRGSWVIEGQFHCGRHLVLTLTLVSSGWQTDFKVRPLEAVFLCCPSWQWIKWVQVAMPTLGPYP